MRHIETINDKKLLEDYAARSGVRQFFSGEMPHLFLLHYAPGELLTTPFSPSIYVQFIVQGNVLLYEMPNEDSTVTLQTNYNEVTILGDMELLNEDFVPLFVEAKTDVRTLALFREQNRERLLSDPVFLRYLCRCLANKINGAVTTNRAGSVKERVLLAIRRTEAGERLSDVGRMARALNVSTRQLLRVMKQLCAEGVLEHIDKGVYVVREKPEIPRDGMRGKEET